MKKKGITFNYCSESEGQKEFLKKIIITFGYLRIEKKCMITIHQEKIKEIQRFGFSIFKRNYLTIDMHLRF